MELVGDMGHVESRFGLIGNSVSVGVKKVHDLNQMCRRLRNHFGRTRWYSYVMMLKRKLVLVRLVRVIILTQDRCTVCTEHTIGSENILDTPAGTSR